jgi:hypothetical protein
LVTVERTEKCCQLKEKIIPAFEEAHKSHDEDKYQAVFLIDNSQGHAAYPDNALWASEMNLKPGSKQPLMRDGWFMKDGQQVSQKMVFGPENPGLCGQPKGIKQVLDERGLWPEGRFRLKCANADSHSGLDCCAQRLLSSQPDFREQRSTVQEVIEEAGHICLFLPKYHCELNFIEYFWGAVKHYLRENCDYSFTTLKANLPKAMASIGLDTIQKWENQTWRWIEAYCDGLDAKSAQMKVRAFSSRIYTSHRRASERVGQELDKIQG